MEPITVIADSEQKARELADDIYSEATKMHIEDRGIYLKRKVIRLAFEIDYQEDYELTNRGFAQAIQEGIPKEYWTDNALDEWGILQIFPLDNDGRLMSLRPR